LACFAHAGDAIACQAELARLRFLVVFAVVILVCRNADR
jgi:hypothetical protein